MVGNIVDPIYAVKTQAGEPNPDEETRNKLEEIRSRYFGPYFRQLKTEGKQND
jgi:hypothetical protein